jgi:hypothetical protein
MNLKKLCALLFPFLSLSGFCQTEIQLLNTAYAKDSAQLFTSVLNQWHQSAQNKAVGSSPVNDTILDAYSVFQYFFRPENFDTIAGTVLSKQHYQDHLYLPVQNSIDICFTNRLYYSQAETDSIGLNYSKTQILNLPQHPSDYDFMMKNYGYMPKDLIRDMGINKISASNPVKLWMSISDFRPQISPADKKVIYLSSHIDTVINAFLGNKYVAGYKRVFTLSAQAENTKRKKALEQYLKLWYGKTDGGWQLISYPYVQSLTFDKDRSYVSLNIRLPYLTGTVMMKRDASGWKIIKFTHN